jgi:hypothetical protein
LYAAFADKQSLFRIALQRYAADLPAMSPRRSDATYVAGFRAWLGLGRHVRKGEKGIAILAPIISKRKRHAEEQQSDDSNSMAEAVGQLVGFRSTHVYERLSRDLRPGFCALDVARDPTSGTRRWQPSSLNLTARCNDCWQW